MIQDDSVSIPSGVMQFNKSRSAAMRKCIQSISMLLVMATAALVKIPDLTESQPIRSQTRASYNHLATRMRLAFKSRSITQVETAYK
jgi:hypothetical protein